MSIAPLSPGISAGFTVAPEVVYSPIVSFGTVHDKQVACGHRDAFRENQPRDQRGGS